MAEKDRLDKLVKYSDDVREKALQMYFSDEKDPETISTELGIATPVVKRWIDNMQENVEKVYDTTNSVFNPLPSSAPASVNPTGAIDQDVALLERAAYLSKAGFSKDDLAREFTKIEKRNRELENMIFSKNNSTNTVKQGDNMAEASGYGELAAAVKEMNKAMLQAEMMKYMMKSMIKRDSQDDGGNTAKSRELEMVMDRLDRLEKSSEIERAITPLQKQIEELTKKKGYEEMPPQLRVELDALKQTLGKYSEEKKYTDILEKMTREMGAADKNVSMMNMFKELEAQRASYELKQKELESRLYNESRARTDDNYKNQLMGLQQRLDELQNRGGGAAVLNEINNIKAMMQSIKETAAEFKGETPKKDIMETLVAPTLASVAGNLSQAYAQRYASGGGNPGHSSNPGSIEITPEEAQEIMARRGGNRSNPEQTTHATENTPQEPQTSHDPQKYYYDRMYDPFPGVKKNNPKPVEPTPQVEIKPMIAPVPPPVITDKPVSKPEIYERNGHYFQKGRKGFITKEEYDKLK